MSDAWTRPTGRLQSFKHAFAGLRLFLRSERNAAIHGAATVFVVALGLYLGVTGLEWVGLLLAITVVWTAEVANTALERLADALAPELNPEVGKAKDTAAAAVLVASIGAAIVGVLILGRYLIEHL